MIRAMRIVCPHCRTAYKLVDVDEETILVCHRCGAEFSCSQLRKDTEIIDSLTPAKEMHGDQSNIPPPPPPAKARITPWLLPVVLLVIVAGFWFNHDAWLDDPWLRSVLINTGLPLKVRDKDWRIQPKSVQAQWVERDDGSHVLLIKGRVLNLLQCEIIPPAIHFSVFAKDDSEHLLLERQLPISQAPLMSDIRHAPYTAPMEDHTPVSALSGRNFVLVLEGLPENTGDFTLSVIAKNPD